MTTLAAVAGVLFGVKALKHGNELQREDNHLQAAQLDASLEEGMMGIDRYFGEHPALRPFFFSKHEGLMPKRVSVRSEAQGTAEMIIDFADGVAAYARMGKMTEASEDRWTGIIQPYFEQSPVVRQIWEEASPAYDSVTACFLGAPDEVEIARWKWQTNNPKAPLSRTCVSAG